MKQTEFKQRLRQGHGRCFLTLQKSENIAPYRASLLWGCLHNIAFDAQCEGTKAAYLYRLLSLFPDREWFLGGIAEKYRTDPGRDIWLFAQLTELLICFADDGFPAAKEALWEKYEILYARLLRKKSFRGHSYDYTQHNFEHLSVLLLRERSNEFPAKLITDYGNLFLQNRHYTEGRYFDWFFISLEKSCGKRKLQSELEKHRADPAWKSFAESYRTGAVQPRATHLKPAPSNILTADELIDRAKKGESLSFALLRGFSRNAAPGEKEKLAAYIDREPDPAKKAALLPTFFPDNYPGDHEKLIEYAESPCETLSRYAERLLCASQSETVYRYAKKRLSVNRDDPTTIEMLLTNYRPTDRELLLSILAGWKIDPDSSTGWHGIVSRINTVGKQGGALPKEFFRFVYENSLCGNCREEAVRQMGKRRWLTAEIMAEGLYDSNPQIVAYLRKKA